MAEHDDPSLAFFPDSEGEPDLYGCLGVEEKATSEEVGSARVQEVDEILTGEVCVIDPQSIQEARAAASSRQGRRCSALPADRVRVRRSFGREAPETVR